MLPVGRFFGVPIFFAPSWLLIAGLLTVIYAPIVVDSVDGISASASYLVAFTFAVLFAICVLAHELGHTAMALALGSPVRRVVIFLLGGISEIERDPRRPRDELLIAAAGPLVSVVLSAVLFGAYTQVEHRTMIGVLLGLLWSSNVIVVVFNLLPGLPLDGGRILRATIWSISRSRVIGTRVAAWSGRGLAVLVALSAVMVTHQAWGVTAGVFSLALAAYLWFGAGQALRVGEMLERLPRIDIQRLLRPGLLVPSDISVAEALQRAWNGQARGLVLTDAADRPFAIADETRVGAIAPERRPWTRLVDVSRQLEPGLILPVTLAGEDLMDRVRATPAAEYLVVHPDGSPAGILATADLAAALQGAR